MVGIENWLAKQGLGKYASMFVDNEIEIDDLAYLSEDDLEKLGLPIGPRKRLLAAVQAAQPQSTGFATGNLPETEHRPIAGAETGAEHRQLTVMFADLVGSVELGELLDVADYRDLLSRFRNDVVAAVQRYDGFVARHQGDGLLVYFGYPQAHENDA
jgi:class 3 adenylate cyclase